MKNMLLIKNADLYTPESVGISDLLICKETILKVAPHIKKEEIGFPVEVIDAQGKKVIPGYVDQHVHIIGGGGEAGPYSRVPEVMLSEITKAGVTTVIGLLGTDGTCRHHEELLAKARALETEGITAYIMTGSYEYPLRTIIGDARKDIVLIDKVIAIGELAISDHRSSETTLDELKRVATQAHLGGMLSGKTSPLHLHTGVGKSALDMLFAIVRETEVPASKLIPSHINRAEHLFKHAMEFAKIGGYIDITSGLRSEEGFTGPVDPHDAIRLCIDNDVPMDRVTMSSDGNGSMSVPQKEGKPKLLVTKLASLHEEVRRAVLDCGVPFETAIQICSTNPARAYGLFPRKGCLREDSDGDLIILDEDMMIDTVVSRGTIMIRNKEILIKGTFEE